MRLFDNAMLLCLLQDLFSDPAKNTNSEVDMWLVEKGFCFFLIEADAA